MLIYNVKLNKKKIFKSCLAIMLIIVISIGIVALYNVLNSLKNNNDNNFVEDSIPSNDVAVLKPENYTNVLKEVHENIDTYIGQKISFSGFEHSCISVIFKIGIFVLLYVPFVISHVTDIQE